MPKTTTRKNEKIECTNPNTGRTMQIEADTWNLFYAAITESLKGGKKLTFTELVEAIENYLEKKKIDFKQSVGWYAVTVKHDLHVKKILDVFTEKGKKLHQLNLKNQSRSFGTNKEEEKRIKKKN